MIWLFCCNWAADICSTNTRMEFVVIVVSLFSIFIFFYLWGEIRGETVTPSFSKKSHLHYPHGNAPMVLKDFLTLELGSKKYNLRAPKTRFPRGCKAETIKITCKSTKCHRRGLCCSPLVISTVKLKNKGGLNQ